jgi:hypothetical protein
MLLIWQIRQQTCRLLLCHRFPNQSYLLSGIINHTIPYQYFCHYADTAVPSLKYMYSTLSIHLKNNANQHLPLAPHTPLISPCIRLVNLFIRTMVMYWCRVLKWSKNYQQIFVISHGETFSRSCWALSTKLSCPPYASILFHYTYLNIQFTHTYTYTNSFCVRAY